MLVGRMDSHFARMLQTYIFFSYSLINYKDEIMIPKRFITTPLISW